MNYLGPTIAPQNPAVQPLGWKGGVLITPSPFLRPSQFGLLIMLAALHLPRKCTGLRDSLLTLFLTRSYRLGIQDVLLMASIYGTALIRRFVLMR